SNVSLHYVSVPLHQVVRGTVPVFTVLISLAWRTTAGYSWRVYASLAPVVVGVGLATYGDYYSFSVAGFLLTLLGTVLAATKTVVTNSILVGGYRLKLSALDLLYQLCPLALVQTLAWAAVTGELTDAWAFVQALRSSDSADGVYPLATALVANGAIAFVLNVASFTASKNTSALAMTVTGNVKVVLAVVLGCVLFSVRLSWLSTLGCVLTIAGGAAYSAVRLSEAPRVPKSVVPFVFFNGMDRLVAYLVGVVESSYEDLAHLVPCGSFLGLFDERPIKRARRTVPGTGGGLFEFDNSEATCTGIAQLAQTAISQGAAATDVLRAVVDAVRSVHDASAVLDIGFRALFEIYQQRLQYHSANR
ncbi:hypothetical protein IWW51_006097, partial [Coemansia sp. RSA 2702]